MRNKEFSWFMLSNAPGFGAKSIRYIYNNLKSNNLTINDLFDLNLEELKSLFPKIGHGDLSRANLSSFSSLEADRKFFDSFEKLKSEGIVIVGLDDDRYPISVLENMEDTAPPILYCKGNLPLLNQKSVSIVGSRDIGEFEISITKSIAKNLSKQGINVISGYAKGVDTSAHLGALESHGTTIMILSYGANYIFIKKEINNLNWENSSLFVTQFSPDSKFSGQNAMIRNKLVCAMSTAIVVIKSGPEKDIYGKKSGTFDAGKSALKMGIPVFVLNPQGFNMPQGNMDLIKIGGIEFSHGMDIFNFLDEKPLKEFVKKTALVNEKTEKSTSKQPLSYQTNLF